jgi:hypothetical protein
MKPSQPLFEVTLTRPWHWGIALIFDQGGDAPDVNPQELVSLGPSGMVILVRHAQDSIESLDGDRDWATASLHVACWPRSSPHREQSHVMPSFRLRPDGWTLATPMGT